MIQKVDIEKIWSALEHLDSSSGALGSAVNKAVDALTPITVKAVLRDYINATIGFEDVSRVFDKSSKSLMRMFGPKGTPRRASCLR